MKWMSVKNGYVDCTKIESIHRTNFTNFIGEEVYRIVLVMSSGSTIIYNEYDTIEECEAAMDYLVVWLTECED